MFGTRGSEVQILSPRPILATISGPTVHFQQGSPETSERPVSHKVLSPLCLVS